MRNLTLLTCLACLWTACASEPSAPVRPERTNLLAHAEKLQGDTLSVLDSDGWVIRRFGRGRTDVAFEEGAPGAPMVRAVGFDAAPEMAPDSGAVATSTLADPESPKGSVAQLRAGITDDNLHHKDFIAYLQKNKAELKGRIEDLEVADRREVVVLTAAGDPIPSAVVLVIDEDQEKVVWRGTTYGDGRFPIFKSLLADNTAVTLLLEVHAGDHFVRHRWNGAGDQIVVRMPEVKPDLSEIELDVVFLIDTTGSMADEIAAIKETLLAVTAKLEGLDREFDLRYGAVLYRDITDAYVTKAHAFTTDIAAFDKALKKITAEGGGDTPESLNQGLAVAIDGMKWRKGAAKVVFLIADAPPHLDYENDVPYGKSLEAAVAQGIRIHAVAASGLDKAGTAVFRQVAHFARGKFIFIEYGGSVQKTAEGHGVKGKVKGNNLDDILFEQIRDEIARWGRRAG